MTVVVDPEVVDTVGDQPSARLRPTTLLSGLFYIDIVPGGDRTAEWTQQIPVDRTRLPTEVDDVAERLQPDALEGAKTAVTQFDETLATPAATRRCTSCSPWRRGPRPGRRGHRVPARHPAGEGPDRRRAGPAADHRHAQPRARPTGRDRREPAGHQLIPPVPLPRKPTADLFKLPGNVRGAVKRVREVLEAAEADVVVGFGGFVSLPAYLGARGRVPIVVHEANARAGLANKVGARFASAVCVAVPGTGLANEEVVGMPLRRSITTLDRASLRPEARTHFNLPPHGPVLLVFGGSQGARTLNDAVAESLPAFTERGISVLHAYGKNGTPADPRPGYVPVPYIERMDLAYAAADVVLGRSGMTTVAELTAVGLPAVYVPLPHGNGEQALNARPVVEAGGGKLVQDEDMNGDRAIDELMPMLTDPDLALAMGRRARAAGHGEADERIARIVMEVAGR
nr:UDP-N-acetylglucosamine--N-acetylmuramyl-(pentapeptide) pyrophosphoryl-undecaprenol N-acetylglucosamine transferase [Pseudonocardia sp. ICBG1034]